MHVTLHGIACPREARQRACKMLQSRSFVKKTKKGKVLKVVREHYLRDDIYSGSPLDPECDQAAAKLSASAPHYLIVDTNIVLQQVRKTYACALPWSAYHHLV